MSARGATCACGHGRDAHWSHALGQDCAACGFDRCRRWAPARGITTLLGMLGRDR